jgi:hypothetical protein
MNDDINKIYREFLWTLASPQSVHFFGRRATTPNPSAGIKLGSDERTYTADGIQCLNKSQQTQ